MIGKPFHSNTFKGGRMSREQAYMRLYYIGKGMLVHSVPFFLRKNILFPMRSSMFF